MYCCMYLRNILVTSFLLAMAASPLAAQLIAKNIKLHEVRREAHSDYTIDAIIVAYQSIEVSFRFQYVNSLGKREKIDFPNIYNMKSGTGGNLIRIESPELSPNIDDVQEAWLVYQETGGKGFHHFESDSGRIRHYLDWNGDSIPFGVGTDVSSETPNAEDVSSDASAFPGKQLEGGQRRSWTNRQYFAIFLALSIVLIVVCIILPKWLRNRLMLIPERTAVGHENHSEQGKAIIVEKDESQELAVDSIEAADSIGLDAPEHRPKRITVARKSDIPSERGKAAIVLSERPRPDEEGEHEKTQQGSVSEQVDIYVVSKGELMRLDGVLFTEGKDDIELIFSAALGLDAQTEVGEWTFGTFQAQPVFNTELELAGDFLGKEKGSEIALPAGLYNEFKKNGITLSDGDAKVIEKDRIWSMPDKYVAKREKGRLCIYQDKYTEISRKSGYNCKSFLSDSIHLASILPEYLLPRPVTVSVSLGKLKGKGSIYQVGSYHEAVEDIEDKSYNLFKLLKGGETSVKAELYGLIDRLDALERSLELLDHAGKLATYISELRAQLHWEMGVCKMEDYSGATIEYSRLFLKEMQEANHNIEPGALDNLVTYFCSMILSFIMWLNSNHNAKYKRLNLGALWRSAGRILELVKKR